MLTNKQIESLRKKKNFKRYFDELERHKLFDSEGDFYGGMTGKAVIELLQVLEKQDHSGMSRNIVTKLFYRLAKGLPLSSVTNDLEEWEVVGQKCGHACYRNIRCPQITMSWDSKQEKYQAYDTNAVIFSNDGGKTWFSSADSTIQIELPYNVPIDVKKVYVSDESDS